MFGVEAHLRPPPSTTHAHGGVGGDYCRIKEIIDTFGRVFPTNGEKKLHRERIVRKNQNPRHVHEDASDFDGLFSRTLAVKYSPLVGSILTNGEFLLPTNGECFAAREAREKTIIKIRSLCVLGRILPTNGERVLHRERSARKKKWDLHLANHPPSHSEFSAAKTKRGKPSSFSSGLVVYNSGKLVPPPPA